MASLCSVRMYESQLSELDLCESLRALARVPHGDLRAFEAAEAMEAQLLDLVT